MEVERKIFVFPGMGADARMYQGAWQQLAGACFVSWPALATRCDLDAVAERVIAEYKIDDDCVLIGSSLGGMVACEIAKKRRCRHLILLGSAVNKQEVNPLLLWLQPLIHVAPLSWIQFSSGKVPMELTQMFHDSDDVFIRSMCQAIHDWQGYENRAPKAWRIHGVKDLVIQAPAEVDLLLDAGHLLAMTHAQECVDFIETILQQEINEAIGA